MTDIDIAPLAKAGVAWAVNELLRRCLPEIRSIVGAFATRMRTSFDVREDAISEALLAVWRSIPAWDPERASLTSFARTNIIREVIRVAAAMGHAVEVPRRAAKKRQQAIAARHHAMRFARGIAEPAYDGSSSNEEEVTYEDIVPAAVVPVDEQIDVVRILDDLSERDASILWRSTCGETYAEIGADTDDSKQCIKIAHSRALERAQRVATACFKRTT